MSNIGGSDGNFNEASKPIFNENDDDDDPVNYLGFGIVSYFSLIKTLIFIFFVLTVVHIPILLSYSRYDNYTKELTNSF